MITTQGRLQAIKSSFLHNADDLISAVERLDEPTATSKASDGGWNPAQIACHVAIVNEWVAGPISGTDTSLLGPKPEGFQETLATMTSTEKEKTYPFLEPPEDITRAEALRRLIASGDRFVAALGMLSEDRGAKQCAQLPFGTVSLYELGEFAAAHVARHADQLKRTVAAL